MKRYRRVLSIQKLAGVAGIDSASALQKVIGGSKETAADLFFGRVTMIRLETIDKLCELFRCQPNDLFEFVQVEEESKPPSKR
jgi:DNA-binding Xre family transcriptional regulator